VLSTPVPEPDHLNASYAGAISYTGAANAAPDSAPWRHDPELSGQGAADVFTRVDPVLARSGLGAAEFGTIAHLCVEALLSNQEPRIPSSLGGRLTPAEAETLREGGKQIARRFLASPLGAQAQSAPYRRSEYPFRSLWERGELPASPTILTIPANPPGRSVFINGIIDLLFEWENEVRVVDFKTDSVENPAEHRRQMAFYERAARELRGKPCRVWLYYLRTGRAVEIARPG
ncbi:MAG: PD-(D/E)XK nuclease family protein, partial [Treponema sp.]|nr:PD-(D/E)XK nuclease family protein [Treponema sp.]